MRLPSGEVVWVGGCVGFRHPLAAIIRSMGPVGHTAVSTVIGASVWGATGSPLAGAVAVGAGVVVDIDHLVDYYRWWVMRRPDKVLVLLHGWEYSIVGLLVLNLVFYHPIFLAVVLAHLGHVATDHFHNRLSPLGYSIVYRAWVRFDAQKIAPGIHLEYSYLSLPGMFPMRRMWEPWYRRKIEPWIAARVGTRPPQDTDHHHES